MSFGIKKFVTPTKTNWERILDGIFFGRVAKLPPTPLGFKFQNRHHLSRRAKRK